MEAVQFHSKRFEEAVRELESDAERGLSADEAQRRVAKFGHNELTEKPRPGFLALLRDQFNTRSSA